MNINPLNQIKIQTPPNPLRPDILCPYCLKELHSKDITVRCNICGTEAPTPKSGKEMIWSKIPINKVQKCGCGGIFNVRECGHCTEKLPSDILEYKKIFTLQHSGYYWFWKNEFFDNNASRITIDNKFSMGVVCDGYSNHGNLSGE